jgi:hypothetical protein
LNRGRIVVALMNPLEPFDPSDVDELWLVVRSRSTGKARALRLTLRHRPTTLVVTGTVALKERSRGQQAAAKQRLRRRLMRRLADAVARFLRLG